MPMTKYRIQLKPYAYLIKKYDVFYLNIQQNRIKLR